MSLLRIDPEIRTDLLLSSGVDCRRHVHPIVITTDLHFPSRGICRRGEEFLRFPFLVLDT